MNLPVSGSAPTQFHNLLMTRSTRQGSNLNTWSFQEVLYTQTTAETISPGSLFPVKILLRSFIYVCGHGFRHVTPHLWISPSSLWESLFSFSRVDSLQLSSLVVRPSTSWVFSLAPCQTPSMNSEERAWPGLSLGLCGCGVHISDAQTGGSPLYLHIQLLKESNKISII